MTYYETILVKNLLIGGCGFGGTLHIEGDV
jgi:hypothetical protein